MQKDPVTYNCFHIKNKKHLQLWYLIKNKCVATCFVLSSPAWTSLQEVLRLSVSQISVSRKNLRNWHQTLFYCLCFMMILMVSLWLDLTLALQIKNTVLCFLGLVWALKTHAQQKDNIKSLSLFQADRYFVVSSV